MIYTFQCHQFNSNFVIHENPLVQFRIHKKPVVTERLIGVNQYMSSLHLFSLCLFLSLSSFLKDQFLALARSAWSVQGSQDDVGTGQNRTKTPDGKTTRETTNGQLNKIFS